MHIHICKFKYSTYVFCITMKYHISLNQIEKCFLFLPLIMLLQKKDYLGIPMASNIIFKDFKNFHFENLRNANSRQTVNLYVSERGLSSFY